MDKSPDAFRTISEVADWLGVQAHVLRFWESKFTHVKPVKRAGGRRYYRPTDMQLLGGIKKLLHDDGLTIKGVQKILREQGVAHVSSLSQDLGDGAGDAAGTIEAEATIVPFKSTAAPIPDPQEDTPAPDDPEQESQQAADAPGADAEAAQPTDAPAPETTPEPTAPETTPEPVAAQPDPPVEDKPILPSFLHRPAPASPKPKSIAAKKKSLVVEAPDPPAEADLPYAGGPLATLARLDRLSAEQAARIAPLAAQLQAWLARSGGAGAA